MSAGSPISSESFAAAIRELDPDAFAAFVAELWAATAEEIRVDAPVVTARNGDVRRLRVATSDWDGRVVDRIDAIVVADPSAVPEKLDVPVIEPADLRRRLLYAHSPAAADDLCRRFLDRPARSPGYEPADENVAAVDGSNSESEGSQSPAVDTTAPRQELNETNGPGATGEGQATVEFGAIAQTDGRGSIAGPADMEDSQSQGSVADRLTARKAWMVVVALVVLTAVVAGAVSGVGPFEERSDNLAGEAVANATTATQAPVETATPDRAKRTRNGDGREERRGDRDGTSDGANDGKSTVTVTFDSEWSESNPPVPTCNRSVAAVVEIQLRALAHTGETNDGIRTVRQFSSPRNRDLTGSFEQFVDIVRSPTYAPLLSADGATYTPRHVDSNTAFVDVSLFRDGDATESYRFRLRKQGSGEYEGCWMIAGVGTR